MDMFSCAKDYTQNPVEQTENTCDTVKMEHAIKHT